MTRIEEHYRLTLIPGPCRILLAELRYSTAVLICWTAMRCTAGTCLKTRTSLDCTVRIQRIAQITIPAWPTAGSAWVVMGRTVALRCLLKCWFMKDFGITVFVFWESCLQTFYLDLFFLTYIFTRFLSFEFIKSMSLQSENFCLIWIIIRKNILFDTIRIKSFKSFN